MIAVHLENGRVGLRRQPLPRVAKGFARIRMLAAGICSTDLELQRGYYGFQGTPGHEFVGEVVEVSDANDSRWIRARVAGEINLACGHCGWCRRGLGRHCPTRTVLGIVKHPGAFREFLTLPASQPAMLNFQVDDLDGVLAKLATAGVSIDPKREDYDYGRFGWFTDPQGNRVELWQPKP